jgi:TRAP-type C4-dicarboxylate transport system permease large subunit
LICACPIPPIIPFPIFTIEVPRTLLIALVLPALAWNGAVAVAAWPAATDENANEEEEEKGREAMEVVVEEEG